MGFSKKSFIKHEQNAVVLSTIEHAPQQKGAAPNAPRRTQKQTQKPCFRFLKP